MAQHQSAKKRVRTSEKRRIRNKAYKTSMKSSIKRVRASENKEEATAALKDAQSVIDKLVSKGIIKKNTAANKKSRLTRHVNAMT
jgi:small subunit ribosomal protein S20